MRHAERCHGTRNFLGQSSSQHFNLGLPTGSGHLMRIGYWLVREDVYDYGHEEEVRLGVPAGSRPAGHRHRLAGCGCRWRVEPVSDVAGPVG